MNIIVTPLYGIGDVLMTTPALKILKDRLGDSRITCVCMFENNYKILSNNPHIDSLIYFPFLEKGKLETLRFLLPLRGKFDCSINFYPSNRRQYNIFAYLIGADIRIGHRYMRRDRLEFNFLKNRTITEDRNLHNVEENIRLLEFLGVKSDNIPAMELYLTPAEESAGRRHIKNSGRRKKIGVHAGASIFKGHANKRWPKERFVELINNLDDCDFYLFGGPDDGEINEYIFETVNDKDRVVLVQGFPIREVAGVIKHLDLFVSNDSGLMHLAAATGVPVVALFGPTNPDFVRPWGVEHKVVRVDLDCSPCFYYSPKPLECTQPDKFKCIKELPVSMVQGAVKDLLQETGKEGK